MAGVGDGGDEAVQHESVFRAQWRERHCESGRPGDLIAQPGWIDSGLWTLGLLVAAGVLAAASGTVARTATLPAVAHGTWVSAIRSGEPAPRVGDTAQFRDSSGGTQTAVVVEVTATEVRADLNRSVDADVSPGRLEMPAGRQPLITVLLPRFW
jgi:hypothetical protein